MQCCLEEHKNCVFYLKVPDRAFLSSAQKNPQKLRSLASMLVSVIVNPSAAKLGAPVVVLYN